MNWKNWIGKAIKRLTHVFDTAEQVPASSEEPIVTPAAPVKSAPRRSAAPRRGRPVSSTLEKAIELLAGDPQITPAQLAQKLSVSRDYGRTLLRRARARLEQEPRPAASKPAAAAKKMAAVPSAPPSTPPEAACTPSLSIPFPQSINLNRRVQVLRLASQGEAPQSIAARVGIPTGEVEFVLKMDRLLREAV
jgi:hypothetical protein